MRKILKKQTVYNMKNIRHLRNIDKLILETLLYTFKTIVILTPLNSRDAHIQIFCTRVKMMSNMGLIGSSQ